LADGTGLRRILEKVRPDEVYNLGAQSHVKVSFEQPEYTADIVATGTLRLLEAMRDYISISGKEARFYQACSSEMFGRAAPPQSETTPFQPRSPYAVSKVAAHMFAVNYREAYGLFIVNGILFNHESPRRGETFVTRKITRAVGRIKLGMQKKLYLGNLDAVRDWGFAGDYVEVATGEPHSVREFLELAFGIAGLDWREYVEVDPRYFRPSEVDYLLGNPRKIRERTGWRPKTSFDELVQMMVESDMELARRECTLKNAGHMVEFMGAGE
jgi:GDPmannose 4,6-dehydratase